MFAIFYYFCTESHTLKDFATVTYFCLKIVCDISKFQKIYKTADVYNKTAMKTDINLSTKNIQMK